MKYLEGMEEDITVRPEMPSVGPGSMGKASPQELCLLERERERERGKVFFVGVEVNG
jgi:hypothetical protein